MTNLVLYRKYRSQNFDEVVGQLYAVTTLKKSIIKNMVGHAYLFSGPRGVGKTSVARILARSVNCLQLSKDGNPCNECNPCKNFINQSSLDLVEIDAASHRGIDDIRFLQEGVSFLPTETRKKVIIIDEVHMLTKEAFNALLKTLEEPPAHVLFILATTEIEKVPETIVSRCQHFVFERIATSDLTNFLVNIAKKEGNSISEKEAAIIADNSFGGARDALGTLEQLLIMEPQGVTAGGVEKVLGLMREDLLINIVDGIIFGKCEEVLNCYYEEVYTKGIDGLKLLKNLQSFLRKLLLISDGVLQQDGSLKKYEARDVVLLIDVLQEIQAYDFEIDSLYFELFVNKSILGLGHKIDIEKKQNLIIEEKKTDIAVEEKEIKKDADEKSIKEESEVNNYDSIDQDLFDQYKNNFLSELAKNKPFLASIIRMCEINCFDNVVEFVAPLIFQKEQLENPANKLLIQQIIEGLCAKKIQIVCRLNQNNQILEEKKKQWNEENNRNSLNEVMEVFGGKLAS